MKTCSKCGTLIDDADDMCPDCRMAQPVPVFVPPSVTAPKPAATPQPVMPQPVSQFAQPLQAAPMVPPVQAAAEAPRNCPHCGKYIQYQGARYCPSCQGSLSAAPGTYQFQRRVAAVSDDYNRTAPGIGGSVAAFGAARVFPLPRRYRNARWAI